MNKNELASIAQSIMQQGKGILAADESFPSIEKRFKSIGIESTEENRRAYRDLLLTAEGSEEFISGVILFDETIRQKAGDGTPFPQALSKRGIIPGIKVDKGAKDMPGFPGEKITEGLDGLRDRLKEYHDLGARFAKWRGVIDIADGIPTTGSIEANAEALARYAALCQEAGIVPIVEPEVLMDGGHDLARCDEVTTATLQAVFARLAAHRVFLGGMLLKPNMIISGAKCSTQASVQEVAEATVCCFKRTVPAAVPGIVFLSGGQSSERATEHLDAINRMANLPWEISFSYGRALQAAPLDVWKGLPENVPAAQKAYCHRAKLNSAARKGQYESKMESMAA